MAINVQRFWSFVRKSAGCWLWQGKPWNSGYGRYSGRLAHRVSWELTYGPTKKCVLHKCDTPLCVRPDHLFEGTRTDNARDRDAKGRTATGNRHGSRTQPERVPRGEQHWTAQDPSRCARGARHGRAVLTEPAVVEIRQLVAGGATHGAVARRFGVARETVGKIARREKWQHV